MKSYSHVPLIQRLRQATSATVRIRVLYVIIGKGIFKTMNEKKGQQISTFLVPNALMIKLHTVQELK